MAYSKDLFGENFITIPEEKDQYIADVKKLGCIYFSVIKPVTRAFFMENIVPRVKQYVRDPDDEFWRKSWVALNKIVLEALQTGYSDDSSGQDVVPYVPTYCLEGTEKPINVIEDVKCFMRYKTDYFTGIVLENKLDCYLYFFKVFILGDSLESNAPARFKPFYKITSKQYTEFRKQYISALNEKGDRIYSETIGRASKSKARMASIDVTELDKFKLAVTRLQSTGLYGSNQPFMPSINPDDIPHIFDSDDKYNKVRNVNIRETFLDT